MNTEYFRLLCYFILYFLFYILSAYLGVLNLYSLNINHSAFYVVYNIHAISFLILGFIFRRNIIKNKFFYIFTFPIVLYLFIQIMVYLYCLDYSFLTIMPVVIMNYVLLGFWILPVFLWISFLISDYLLTEK